MDNKPNLIEPGTKYYLKNTLESCKKFREKHINFILNLSLISGFILILSLILYFRYKGNISLEEKNKKIKKEKEYIMTKLVQISDYKKKKSQNLITNLPEPDFYNNPETIILNRKIY
tara:strand:- start:1641 stop:1991 length:351 start_codon:yes stop_codon:yes gene_type:complete